MRLANLFVGWFAVAVKEIQATLFRPRLLVIAALLALAVLGGTYGILAGPGGGGGSVPERLTYSFTYYPDLNRSRPAIAVFVASPTGTPVVGLEVWLVNVTSSPGPFGEPSLETLESKDTDASGWARFEGLAQQYPNRTLALVLADSPQNPFGFAFTHPEGGMPVENVGQLYEQSLFLGGPGGGATVSLVFIDAQGTPLEGAEVYIWSVRRGASEEAPPEGWGPYLNGTTNANGYYLRSEPLRSGFYVLRAVSGTLEGRSVFGFGGGSTSPLEMGPDGVLAFSGLIFLPLLLPIMALAIGYDAIAREKSEGSLDLLLSKPVSRTGVALGKVGGAFAAMAVPSVAVLVTAAGLVWGLTGKPPTGSFLAAFVGIALFLLLAYELLFLAISALMRNLGTALLFSVLLFLLFGFFWGLISFLLASLLAPVGSVRWFELIVTLSLVSPSGVYQNLLSLSLPGGLFGGFFGGLGGGSTQTPAMGVAVSAIVWIAAPLGLFLWTMRYRVTEH